MSLSECVRHCQVRDHERLGHEHFLLATRSMYLTHEEQEMMLSGWERGWEDRTEAVDNLLAAVRSALDSLDASVNYQAPTGWKESFLDRYGLKLNGRKMEIKES